MTASLQKVVNLFSLLQTLITELLLHFLLVLAILQGFQAVSHDYDHS